MKKIVLCLAAMVFSGMIFAQQDPISSVFDKYTGQEGFITITLTGDMLKMAAQMQEYKKDTTLISQLTELKILVREKSEGQSEVNLYNEVFKLVDRSVFKELMTVKEVDTDIAMLARESDGVISEFILLVGGDDDNVVIHAKGNILLEDIAEMAGSYDFKGLDQLRKFER